jgi:hypothetical protein
MAGRIAHINCPFCGGTLGAPTGSRIVNCHYCGQTSLVDAEGYLPCYFIAPGIEASGAHRALGKILVNPEAPGQLIREARFQSANLYFIPFYELSGRRVGTFTMKMRDDRRATRRMKDDTRVIMNDFLNSSPGVNMPEWGLEGVDFDHIRSERQGLLHPFQRSKMALFGRVFDPKISEDKVIQQSMMRVDMRDSKDKTRLVELRNKLIYYPLWRVRYTYKGRAYGSTLDGVTGRVLAARIPMAERGRVIWMLLTSALVSLWAGKLLRLFFLILKEGQAEQMLEPLFVIGFWLLPFLVLLLGIAFMIIAFGWDQFRYSSELEFRGAKKTVIKINRPAKTGLDRMRDLFLRIGSQMLKQMVQTRKQGW